MTTASVTYKRRTEGKGNPQLSHYLEISHPGGTSAVVNDFVAYCSYPELKTYGLGTAYFGLHKPAARNRIPISGSEVIVDALC
jgi:hypothetical protein